jgi:hypothetical protein
MDDDVFDFGIVKGAPGVGTPGFFGAGIVRENPDQIHGLKISEIKRLGVADAASHDEVQFVHIRTDFPGRRGVPLLADFADFAKRQGISLLKDHDA